MAINFNFPLDLDSKIEIPFEDNYPLPRIKIPHFDNSTEEVEEIEEMIGNKISETTKSLHGLISFLFDDNAVIKKLSKEEREKYLRAMREYNPFFLLKEKITYDGIKAPLKDFLEVEGITLDGNGFLYYGKKKVAVFLPEFGVFQPLKGCRKEYKEALKIACEYLSSTGIKENPFSKSLRQKIPELELEREERKIRKKELEYQILKSLTSMEVKKEKQKLFKLIPRYRITLTGLNSLLDSLENEYTDIEISKAFDELRKNHPELVEKIEIAKKEYEKKHRGKKILAIGVIGVAVGTFAIMTVKDLYEMNEFYRKTGWETGYGVYSKYKQDYELCLLFGGKKPTFDELIKFIHEDNTDKLPYIPNVFGCSDFSETFIKNFKQKGYCASEAAVWLIRNGTIEPHVLVAVPTTDQGLIYVEPQSDRWAFANDLNPGDTYTKMWRWENPNSSIDVIKAVLSPFEVKGYVSESEFGNLTPST